MENTLLNKAETIDRCLNRINSEYVGKESVFETNFTVQDAILLNIERAIQACIDAGSHIVRKNNLGLPQSSRDIFSILENDGELPHGLSISLQQMVGFRNILVHDYKKLDMKIVAKVIQEKLGDIEAFRRYFLNLW